MALGARFAEVLDEARAGSPPALTALYRDLHPRVLRYLQAHDRHEADDLASEVWLDVARGLARFEGGESQFRGWVFTIARRRLIDLRRKAARRRTAPASLESLVRDGPTFDVEALAIDGLASDVALAGLLRHLSPDQAEVVLLRVVGDLSVEETARIVGKEQGAVRALQHRALNRIARKISREAVTP